MIRLTCKCKYCKDYEPFKCHECLGTGKTVMVFEYDGKFEQYYNTENKDLHFWYDGIEGFIFNEPLKKLNPLYLEVVEEQECPECEGSGEFEDDEVEDDFYKMIDCPNCTDGKIEVVTGFYIFGSKKEYDQDLIFKGIEKATEAISEAITGEQKESE